MSIINVIIAKKLHAWSRPPRLPDLFNARENIEKLGIGPGNEAMHVYMINSCTCITTMYVNFWKGYIEFYMHSIMVAEVVNFFFVLST